jgi:hypothetical protein
MAFHRAGLANVGGERIVLLEADQAFHGSIARVLFRFADAHRIDIDTHVPPAKILGGARPQWCRDGSSKTFTASDT